MKSNSSHNNQWNQRKIERSRWVWLIYKILSSSDYFIHLIHGPQVKRVYSVKKYIILYFNPAVQWYQLSIKYVEIGDIDRARVFDKIEWMIRGLEVFFTEGATLKLNTQSPHNHWYDLYSYKKGFKDAFLYIPLNPWWPCISYSFGVMFEN